MSGNGRTDHFRFLVYRFFEINKGSKNDKISVFAINIAKNSQDITVFTSEIRIFTYRIPVFT